MPTGFTPSTLAHVHYRQVISPNLGKAQLSTTQTQADFIFATRGKRIITLHVGNPATVDATITAHGAQSSGSSVGDADVAQLNSTWNPFTATTGAGTYRQITDYFPFIIVRVATTAPPASKITAYVNASGM